LCHFQTTFYVAVRISTPFSDVPYACRANLGPDSSGRMQIPAPIRTLFYSEPESGAHVTEMMTRDWSMIVVDVFVFSEVIVCSVFICLGSVCLIFSAMFIFGARNFHISKHTWNEKPENGVDF